MVHMRGGAVQYESNVANYELAQTGLKLWRPDRYLTKVEKDSKKQTIFGKIIVDSTKPEKCVPGPQHYDVGKSTLDKHSLP
jgi:hypothetical protein